MYKTVWTLKQSIMASNMGILNNNDVTYLNQICKNKELNSYFLEILKDYWVWSITDTYSTNEITSQNQH